MDPVSPAYGGKTCRLHLEGKNSYPPKKKTKKYLMRGNYIVIERSNKQPLRVFMLALLHFQRTSHYRLEEEEEGKQPHALIDDYHGDLHRGNMLCECRFKALFLSFQYEFNFYWNLTIFSNSAGVSFIIIFLKKWQIGRHCALFDFYN